MTGNRIRTARKNARITQENLAKMVGVSRATITRIETEESPNMTIYTALKIADALNVSMDYLFRGDC